jgi:hypothetical protein
MSGRRATSLGWVLGCLLALTSSAPAGADQQIYGDALVNGWQDWSWATVDLGATFPVHSGAQSARVTAGAWEAIYLQHTAFDTAPYAELVFWIHGGATGGQLLQVQALLDGTPQTAVALAPLAAGAWQEITISLTALGVANRPNMGGFWIQDRSGGAQGAFHIDDVSLTAAATPATVNVSVDGTRTVRTMDARHFGVAAAIWDFAFDTPETISLLTEIGNQALRFPGGSLSNDYHWQTGTTGGNPTPWATSFDEFAHVATVTGAQVFISVNYGSGTAAEAAAWVQYSNVTKGYGFRYWEIGNENYGPWETDVNTRPHDPFTYAHRFKDYWDQMKAVDPTIKIGAVAITGEDTFATYTDHPATNPRTGLAHNGWTPVMLATLKTLGVTPDFLVYHRYAQAPGAESDAGLLQSTSSWAADAADLRRQLTDYLGAAGAGVELVCTENNSVFSGPGKQTTSLVNGLFLADSVGEAMKTEFNALIWWDLRNGQETGNNNAAWLYGWRPYGDYGIVTYTTPPGPADRYPTFYVAKLLSRFGRGGDRLVAAASDYGLLSVHAARRGDGSLTLLAINKSPTASLDATISLRGYLPGGPIQVHRYGIPQDEAARTGVGSADVASSAGGAVGTAFALALPPYSATVLSMTGAQPAVCCRDFDGNGRADVLWREGAGALALWLMNGAAVASRIPLGTIPPAWTPVGVADFNHDGKADILWRHASGDVALWLMNGTGVASNNLLGNVPLGWTPVQVADFDGDGRADILWRHTSGLLSLWLMNGAAVVGHHLLGTVPLGWTPAQVGDFDGNGRADILWRHTSGDLVLWLMSGGTVASQHFLGNIGTAWTPVGVGDFSGDGKADILWRDTSGQLALWLMNGGAVAANVFLGSVATAWTAVETGDFNGDGKADILWRHAGGQLSLWFMSGAGVASTAFVGQASASWTTQ